MLKVKNLNKSYFDLKVLDSMDFAVEEGKLTTLLGKNGSGKSTLLNLISGFELPDEGDVTYKGQSLSSLNFQHVNEIFYVHEKINYLLPMNVAEYVEMLAEGNPHFDSDFFQKMVHDRRINLDENFQSYSRGQKMQLVLMIGLASRPKVLLIDEITSVIDVYGRKYFLDLLRKFVDEGNTVVITTNIINELEFYTDQIVILKDRNIVLNSKIEAIKHEFIKLRQPVNTNHEVFNNDCCVWAGVNSDRSISYIMAHDDFKRMKVPDSFVDRRKSTLEDVFIFFFTSLKERNHENAA